MKSEIFFRVLPTQGHRDCWKNGCNSFHPTLPGNWIAGRKKGLSNPNDFDLKSTYGTYRRESLEAFLKDAPKYDGMAWDADDLKSATELDGVCAFKTKIACLSYAPEGWDSETRIVEFEGEYVCDVPEQDGVLARPTREVKFWTPSELYQAVKAQR